MIGDKAREVAAQKVAKSPLATRCIIKQNGLLSQNLSAILGQTDPDIFTFPRAIMKYEGESLYRDVRKRDKSYIIRWDDGINDYWWIRDYEDLKELAQSDWKLDFLLKYGNIDEKLFAICRTASSIRVPIAVDVIKYVTDKEAEYRKIYGTEPPPDYSFVIYPQDRLIEGQRAIEYNKAHDASRNHKLNIGGKKK